MTIGPVTPPTITPGTVVFDYTEFTASYPQFTSISSTICQGNFNLACLLLNNTSASVVQDAPTRQYFLYLLTAHVTQLINGSNSNPPTGLVGRIASGTQGSVSVQAEWAAEMGNAEAFFVQTQYGAVFWQATAPYRTARYISPTYGDLDDAPAVADSFPYSGWDAWPQ